MLVVEKFPWANTTEVTEDVEEAIANLVPGLGGMKVDSTLFRPATYLELAVDNIEWILMIGAGIMLLVLVLFSWRKAFIMAVAALVSTVSALIVLTMLGVTLNMMVIAGLAVALGLVIDDAVGDVQHIARRMQDHRQSRSAGSLMSVALNASLEVRGAMMYASLIMALAVVPVLLLDGLIGALYGPLVKAYLLATGHLLRRCAGFDHRIEFPGSGSQRARRGFILTSPAWSGALFSWSVSSARAVFLVLCLLAVVVAGSGYYLQLNQLLPKLKETDLVVRWLGGSEVSHPAMSRIAGRALAELRAIPGVRTAGAHIGRAILSDRRQSINAGELWVGVDPGADYDKTVEKITEVATGYPGMSAEVLTYLQANVREESDDVRSSLVVRVYGQDFKVLRTKADEVLRNISDIDGISKASVQFPSEMPTLEIETDIEKAKAHGLKPGDVRRAATTLVSGLRVGNLFEEQKVFDVMVYGAPGLRHSVRAISNLLIDTPSGEYVRLEDVAHVRVVPAVTVINRDAVSRMVDVAVHVEGRPLVDVAKDVARGISKISFPLEYRAELLGDYAKRIANREKVLVSAIAAAIVVYLLLQAAFRSWSLSAAVFLTLPMALSGGAIVAYLVGGGVVSVGSMFGFVAVLGLVVRNSIALVGQYRHAESAQGESFGPELISRVTRAQSVPILLSTLLLAIAFAVICVAGNIAGLEIVYPMSAVILGGLVSATLYTLAGLPAIYRLFGASREPELEGLTRAPKPAEEASA